MIIIALQDIIDNIYKILLYSPQKSAALFTQTEMNNMQNLETLPITADCLTTATRNETKFENRIRN